MLEYNELSEASLLNLTPRLEYPVSLSGVYALAVNVENMILRALLHLMKQRPNYNDQKLLHQVFNYQLKEAEILKKSHHYELNSELGRFYACGGTVMEPGLDPDDLDENKRLISNTLTYFTREAENIVDEAQTVEDLLRGCLNLRTEASDLFHHLALLYPEGSMRKSLEEISQLIAERSLHFTKDKGRTA